MRIAIAPSIFLAGIESARSNAAIGRNMRANLRSGLSCTLLSTAALIAPAKGDYIPPCAAPSGVSVRTSLAAAPPAVVQALTGRIGELVEPGARFDATDVVITGRNRRLIFVWNSGARWIVATEHGGRGYNDPIFVYDLTADGRSATFVAERIAFPETVCTVASSSLKLGGP